MRTANVAAIILAAGSSSRFGSNKLAHQMTWNYATLPVLAHSLRLWLEVFPSVHVVISQWNAPLQALVLPELQQGQRVQWLLCPDADEGMSRSLAYGVNNCKAAAAWLIGLGDMPYIQTETILAVKTAMEAGAPIAAPYFNGKRGHPIGFNRQFETGLLDLYGDQGAKRLLVMHDDVIYRIDTADPGILMDIDKITDIRVEQPSAA